MKAVYRMNQIKNLYCLLGLISLEMADKMPGNLSVQGFIFLFGFLNTVLPNICNTSIYTPDALLFREDEQRGYKLMESPERLSFISVYRDFW